MASRIRGPIVGTVAYMSPEQAEGRNVDHRTDIFSLGIILYEMVTGQRPFEGETRVALMSSIMKDTPTAVTELNTALPRHLGRIVRLCLAKTVTHRYQAAADVRNELADLKRELDTGEIESHMRDTGGRRWMWPAVSSVLLVGLLLVFLVPQLVPAGQESGSIVVD